MLTCSRHVTGDATTARQHAASHDDCRYDALVLSRKCKKTLYAWVVCGRRRYPPPSNFSRRSWGGCIIKIIWIHLDPETRWLVLILVHCLSMLDIEASLVLALPRSQLDKDPRAGGPIRRQVQIVVGVDGHAADTFLRQEIQERAQVLPRPARARVIAIDAQ